MMFIVCRPNTDQICHQCNKYVRPNVITTCPVWIKKKREETRCPSLGEPTDDSIFVFGIGCSSAQKTGCETQVWECKLHGYCTPLHKGSHLSDPTVTQCSICSDNPNADQQLRVKL